MTTKVGILGYLVITIGVGSSLPTVGNLAEGLVQIAWFSQGLWAALDSIALLLVGIALVILDDERSPSQGKP
jgi:hypothetical protein